MNKFIDFKFYKENFIAIIVLILSIAFIKIFNLEHIPENTFLENLQLIGLFGAFVASLRIKNYKILFNFVAIILFLMFMRELSYGRAIFGRVPGGAPDELYPLSHFKYGYLIHIVVGLYMALGVLYALINKIWINIIDIFKNVKIPIYTVIICVLSVIFALYGEEMSNTCVEETAELVLYFAIMAIVMIYNKKIMAK